MGDKVERKKSNTKPIKFDLKVVTDNPISKIIIFRNNKIIHEIYDPGESVETSWTDENPPREDRLWYYVRVERADNELAWSSPIWFLSPKEMRNSPTHSLARPKSEILVEIEKVVQKNKKRLKEEIIENHLPEGNFDQMKDDRLPPNWNLMTHKRGDKVGSAKVEKLLEGKNPCLKFSCSGGVWTLNSREIDALEGITFIVTLRAKAIDKPTRASFALISPWDLIESKAFTLTTSWKTYTVSATPTKLAPGKNLYIKIDLLEKVLYF